MAVEVDVGAMSGSVDSDESLAALADSAKILHAVLYRQFVVALPHRDPKAKGTSISIRSLDGEPLSIIARRASPGIHDQIVRHCSQAGFVPRIVLEHRETQAPFPFVAAGILLALMPAHYLRTRTRGVKILPLAKPEMQLEIKIAWNAMHASPPGSAFLQIAGAAAI